MASTMLHTQKHSFVSSQVKAFRANASVRASALTTRAAVVPLPPAIKKVEPKGDLVLCKVASTEEKTASGILLPTSAQRKPTSGDIVALGDGRVAGSEPHPFQLAVGNTVLYSKWGLGTTEIEVQDEEFILIREDDVIGIMPQSNAIADDIPELKPVGDRVLLKVMEQADVTVGGVLLPDSAKERPMTATVVRTGPGKIKDGERVPVKVQEGDRVLFFKYAGDAVQTADGAQYNVVRESDILCKTN